MIVDADVDVHDHDHVYGNIILHHRLVGLRRSLACKWGDTMGRSIFERLCREKAEKAEKARIIAVEEVMKTLEMGSSPEKW